MPSIKLTSPVPAHQALATLDQAAPVQNTWYTILNISNCKVYGIQVQVAAVGETLEVRAIVDGVPIGPQAGGFAANAATPYLIGINPADGLLWGNVAGAAQNWQIYSFEGRSVEIQVRKTTAAGAGNLSGSVVFAKW